MAVVAVASWRGGGVRFNGTHFGGGGRGGGGGARSGDKRASAASSNQRNNVIEYVAVQFVTRLS